MGWLQRLFGRNDEDDDSPVNEVALNQEGRRAQLTEFTQILDELLAAMQEPPSPVSNVGWQGRVKDLEYVRGGAVILSRQTITRSELVDLLLGLRPVFPGEPPAGLEHVGQLSSKVVGLAREMEKPLPGE